MNTNTNLRMMKSWDSFSLSRTVAQDAYEIRIKEAKPQPF